MKRPATTAVTALFVAAIVFIAAGCGGSSSSGSNGNNSNISNTSGAAGIAPAFSSSQLASLPTTNWITNGGSIANQRYSPLSQITAGNVAGLKGIWHVHLHSGIPGKYSGEAQPIVYKNVMYVVTGADDVYAIDAHTGATKWVHRAHLNQKIATICCGWTNRGVALGDGKVYVGQLDGKLAALDQQTGDVLWSTQVGRYQQGYTITNAPLYYNGRVYTGISGGEYGIRGRVMAYNAKTGKEDWRFYTIPGPGQVGHDTWPATGNAWKHGGAPVWQTPAVDPKLGLLYFSTGNASPDLYGAKRAGDNLFSSSIVAVDAATGKYRWHFQEVHHDIWDYDATSPVVLFNVSVGGRMRHAIAEAGKTGFVYILDRQTGKPLIGIDERSVEQSPAQKTAATQPFPIGQAFVPQSIPVQSFRAVANSLPKGITLANGGRIFSSFSPGAQVLATPSSLGGDDWFPISFNPKTADLYVCGVSQAQVFGGGKTALYKAGKQFNGSTFAPQGTPTGTFTAIDATTNRIAWQQKFSDSCYSGSTTTAGNLAFVGRNDGHLQAYNATDGKLLWSFQTGAGANNTASVFSLDGKEVVAFYAAGSALAGSAHGDDLWLLGLNGKLGPAPAGSAAGATQHAGEKKPPTTKAPANASTVNVGATEFKFTLSTQTVHTGTITFKVHNVGSIPHNLHINGQQSPDIDPGATFDLKVTFTKPGNYPYLCTIPGHAEAGMKGVLKVS
jgi:quinohemoprotein ethanol dehydrogenase